MKKLSVTTITQSEFFPYGTLIEACEDGVPFGPEDASLLLSEGTPRFYIMSLGKRAMEVRQITRHRKVTQVLASVGGLEWYIVVAPPSQDETNAGKPDLAKMKAFSIPGNKAIKLHRATWHAGPYYRTDQAQFFNLELSDTNITDHHTWTMIDLNGSNVTIEH